MQQTQTNILKEFELASITVKSQMFKTDEDPTRILGDFFVSFTPTISYTNNQISYNFPITIRHLKKTIECSSSTLMLDQQEG